MKRKFLAGFTVTLACACLAFPLAACNDSKDNDAKQNGNEQTAPAKMTEDAWKKAFSEESTSNVTMDIINKVTFTDGEKRTENITMKRNGNVLYQRITTAGSDSVYEIYFSIENDSYYMYHQSEDGWEKQKEDDGTPFAMIMGTDMFGERHADAVFNAEANTYAVQSAESDVSRNGVWTIKFQDEKVSDVLFEGTGYMYDQTPFGVENSAHYYDYGTTAVTLPQVSAE